MEGDYKYFAALFYVGVSQENFVTVIECGENPAGANYHFRYDKNFLTKNITLNQFIIVAQIFCRCC
jgi:hypothetical protein